MTLSSPSKRQACSLHRVHNLSQRNEEIQLAPQAMSCRRSGAPKRMVELRCGLIVQLVSMHCR